MVFSWSRVGDRPAAASFSIPSDTWVQINPTVVKQDATGIYRDSGWTSSAYDAEHRQTIFWETYENAPTYPYTIYSNSIWGLDPVANTLSQLKQDHWYNGPGSSYDTLPYPENSTDPTPPDRHPAFTYVSDRSALFAFAGLNFHIQGIAPKHPDDTWMFDLNTSKWREILPPTHPVSGQDAVWPAITYDPSTRNVVIVNAPASPYGTRYTWFFNIDTEQYEMLTGSPRPSLEPGGGDALAYDSTRKLVWLFGAGNGVYSSGGDELWRLNTATRTWTKVIPNGATPPRRIYHGFVYIPQHDIFLLSGGTAGDGGARLTDTWIYSPTANTWTRLSSSGPTGGELNMSYDPANNVVVAQMANAQWWLYRYAAGISSGDPTAPTVSVTAPSAGATVSGSVALSATAADNVGVVGVRFTVDGSSVGTEDPAAPYTTAWLSGSVADGSHTVRAIARDAAGNSTTSAPITITVQNASPPPSGSCGQGITNAIQSYPTTPLAKPNLFSTYLDPVFGACVQRVTDFPTLGSDVTVPTYSQLSAWNANGTKILLSGLQILNADTYALDHQAPGMSGARWSPADPNSIYSTSGNSFRRYDIRTRQLTTARQFSEYSALERDVSYEEMSDNGRFVALQGELSNGGSEIFVYDVQNNVKSSTISGKPPGSCGGADWVAMAPLGDYLLVNWGGGGSDRYCGVEAYDLSMNYVGKVATGHGHGDLAIAPDGTEWYVYYTHDNYKGITGPRIVKARVPDGYDAWIAGDPNGLVALANIGWRASGHLSCQSHRVGWCAATAGGDPSDGLDPFEGEVYRVFLDSTEASPHLFRLTHHRSEEGYVGSNCSFSSYWAQPHATSNRDGTKIIYGSTWNQTCVVESYVIDVSGSGAPPPPDTTPPAAVSDLTTS